MGRVTRAGCSCWTDAGRFGDTLELFVTGVGILTDTEAVGGGSCARNKVETATVAVPTASSTPAVTPIAVFTFSQVIMFMVPFTRIKVAVPAAAPFAIATTEIVFAKPTGAA